MFSEVVAGFQPRFRVWEQEKAGLKGGHIVRRVTRRILMLAIIVGFFAAGVSFVTLKGGAQESASGGSPDHVIQRGEYLVSRVN